MGHSRLQSDRFRLLLFGLLTSIGTQHQLLLACFCRTYMIEDLTRSVAPESEEKMRCAFSFGSLLSLYFGYASSRLRTKWQAV